MNLWTIGFTGKSARRFFELLSQSGARRIVDVRANNTSQLAAFAKRDDLAYFLGSLCNIDYLHLKELAPTVDLLSDYRKKRIDWQTYEARFLELMETRQIEKSISKDIIDGSCLLCSEKEPHHCHRRLVAEYLQDRWGDLAITHLGDEARS